MIAPTTIALTEAAPRQPVAPGAMEDAKSSDKSAGERFARLLGGDPSSSNEQPCVLPDSANGDDAAFDAAPDPTADTNAGAAGAAIPIGIGNDPAQEHLDQKIDPNKASRTYQLPRDMAATLTNAIANGQASQSSASSATTDNQLQTMLEQLCSGMYLTSEPSVTGSRMLLALDTTLPAAAVEFVRDSAYLRVRLHARDNASLHSMSAQRDALQSALGDATHLQVSVEIIRQEDA
jgi:hypothetical protein